MPRIEDIGAFNAVREAGLAKLMPATPRITVGWVHAVAAMAPKAYFTLSTKPSNEAASNVVLAGVGCFGACFQEPLVNVRLPGSPLVILHRVQANDAAAFCTTSTTGNMTPDLIYCKIEEWDHITGNVKYGHGYPEMPSLERVPFFKGQKKIVLRNCGLINPDDIEEYVAVGGYQALYKVLIEGRPEAVIEQIKASKLRGRGGAGFLTGNKWEFLAKAKADEKYIICNADEGDPGAYMNRNEIESDPHSLLEGMIIGGYVMGATQGIVYVRAEYPLAVHRLNRAIEQAREYGLLGENILGRGFNFDIELVEGAGAFVCGEETALIASLEGHAGRPRPRPPFPAQKGFGACRPTSTTSRPGTTSRHRDARARLVRRNRQPEKSGHEGVLACRKGAEHRTRRDAAGHAAEDLHLRHRRRRHQRASRSKPCKPEGLQAAASRTRCLTRRSITKAWRSLARSWARAAWW